MKKKRICILEAILYNKILYFFPLLQMLRGNYFLGELKTPQFYPEISCALDK
jgi:hypothetical protein